MPKSRQRWVLKRSSSTKLPGSRSWSMRSRAVSLPSAWRLARRSSPPPSSASRFRRSSSARFSLIPMRWIFRREGESLVCAPGEFKVARVDAAGPASETASPDSRASITRRALHRREEDAARLHLAVLVAHADGGSAADDAIDLVFPVRLLCIDAAGGKDIQAE